MNFHKTRMMFRRKEFFGQVKSMLGNEVEYIGIINRHGRLEHAVCKNDIDMSAEKKEMFCMGIRLQNSMESDFNEEHGSVNYTITERENSKFVSIPASSYTILTIMNKNADNTSVINKIKTIVGEIKNLQGIPDMLCDRN